MLKKNAFYLSLIIIYLLVLSKDYLAKTYTSLSEVKTSINNVKETFYETEYKNLSSLVGIDATYPHVIYSKLIKRDMSDFFNKITILKGSQDNIIKGRAVVNEKGLIGLIKSTTKDTSEVMLLTNPNINLSVKINDSYGILTAKDNKIYVKNIKLNNNIKEGDLVTTSGLTSVVEGLLIGKVKNIKKDNLELEYIIEVEPAVDFHHLKYLGVLVS